MMKVLKKLETNEKHFIAHLIKGNIKENVCLKFVKQLILLKSIHSITRVKSSLRLAQRFKDCYTSSTCCSLSVSPEALTGANKEFKNAGETMFTFRL